MSKFSAEDWVTAIINAVTDNVAAQSAARADRLAMQHASDTYTIVCDPPVLPTYAMPQNMRWNATEPRQRPYCRSRAADDARGNCGACGGPR